MNWNENWYFNGGYFFYCCFENIKTKDDRYLGLRIKKTNNEFYYDGIASLHESFKDSWLICMNPKNDEDDGYSGGEDDRKKCNECLNNEYSLCEKIISEVFGE